MLPGSPRLMKELVNMQDHIDKPYAYHRPSADGQERITKLRELFSLVERELRLICPDSRQRAMAVTKNEETAMWAIKSVVFNDPGSVVE